MSLTHFLATRLGLSTRPASPRKTPAAHPRFRPMLEALEDRWVPSTLTVTITANSGTGSLRAEIAAAQSGDTIVFAPSLDGQTITLTKGELLLNKNLTITGPGADQLTISGNNASRVFEVAQGMQVTLSGLTICNGFAVNGAGILVDSGAVAAVSNSTLSGNSASKPQRYVANFGGGIDNYGTTTVSNCTLTNNTSNGGGGGIYNHATLTVNNNSVISGSGDVGIANTGAATISESTVSETAGSAIYNFYTGTVTVSGCLLSHNNASGDGGGVFNMGMATISNSTLSDNSAPEYGGGIYAASNSSNSGKLTVVGCTLSGNSAWGVAEGYGGGIAVISGTASISGCTLSGNSAQHDGGGMFVWHGTATISGCTLFGNSANFGGGIYLAGTGTVTVENSSSITGNNAPAGYGADIYNLGLLYLDSTSTFGILDGNSAQPI